MMTPDQFAEKIKAKHPEYAGFDNAELTQRVIAKYPTYASKVQGFAPEPSTLKGRVSNTIKTAGKEVYENITGTGASAGQGAIRRGVQAASAAATAVPEVALDAAPGFVRKGLEKAGDVAAGLFGKLTGFLGSTQVAMDFVEKHPKAARELEEVLATAKAGGEIAGTILGADAAASGAAKALQAAPAAGRATLGLVERSKGVISPKPAPVQAAKEVLQGETGDLKKGIEALGSRDQDGRFIVDTDGVKTFSELDGKLDDAIAELSNQVDTHLGQNTSLVKLDGLTTVKKTSLGQEVSRNYVSDALDHLKELYKSTGDDVAEAEIDAILAKAKNQGLTSLEVNDISRLYGQEFGDKAFNKLGDPLTSINAQRYENTRTGLKEKAREGMGGKDAQDTDRIISSLYNTKRLVQKNMEAVNKLQQRIRERGLLEKAGYLMAKYADVLTGGTIRGLIGGILPRGAGYKVMNALDLEERLEKNLRIIRDAVEKGSDEEIMQAVKNLAP